MGRGRQALLLWVQVGVRFTQVGGPAAHRTHRRLRLLLRLRLRLLRPTLRARCRGGGHAGRGFEQREEEGFDPRRNAGLLRPAGSGAAAGRSGRAGTRSMALGRAVGAEMRGEGAGAELGALARLRMGCRKRGLRSKSAAAGATSLAWRRRSAGNPVGECCGFRGREARGRVRRRAAQEMAGEPRAREGAAARRASRQSAIRSIRPTRCWASR